MALSRSAGALAWRRCVLRSLSPSLVLPSSWRLRRRRSGSCFLAIPCLCMLARVGIPLALFVPSGLWFVCLVGVVCSPVACGSLLSVSWGCSSYHHFFPHGLPIRYSLIPLMFRFAVLAASCSSCVLWWCPHFLRRWRPIETEKGERGGSRGGYLVGGRVGAAVRLRLH